MSACFIVLNLVLPSLPLPPLTCCKTAGVLDICCVTVSNQQTTQTKPRTQTHTHSIIHALLHIMPESSNGLGGGFAAAHTSCPETVTQQ